MTWVLIGGIAVVWVILALIITGVIGVGSDGDE